jgi:hypothetical protein
MANLSIRQRDYTGHRSGMLTAIAPHHYQGHGWLWTVRCDCGTEKVVRIRKLVEGRIKSCGCARPPPRPIGPPRKRGRPRTHPQCSIEIYNCWLNMLSRCENPKHGAYEYYGGAGITVCERWHMFANFLADMGERPPGTSIDRWPDPYGNYEPGNCRWATIAEQAGNKRKYGTITNKPRKKYCRKS